jgi:Mrp family chromosome partitioning ATPase
VLAALVLAGVSRRLRSARDVADKLGVPTLAELPRSRGRAGRARQEQRFGQLANIARVRLGGPGVVAVAQPEEGIASSVIARELAREWARQGYPTVLVETGAGAVLDSAEPAALRVRPGPVPGLSLLQLGPRSAADAPVLSVSKVTEMLAQEALAGQYVVIEAPGVAQSATAQAVCHAADQTLLVIDTRVTLVPAGREAVAVLRQMDARLMGAVVASRLHDRGEDEAPDGEPAPLAGSLAEGSSPVDAVLHDARPPVDGTRSAALRQGVQRSQE